MKLYYSPGACSQAPHIALTEAGIEFEPVQVDLRAKKLADGSDYLAVNPKGAVPALGLPEGEVLTENAVILQFIGDLKPETGFLPPLGHLDRYRVLEWLNFIATELHKSFTPLFKPDAGDDAKSFARRTIEAKLDYVDQAFGDGPFLMGEHLTLPDFYLFVMTGWAGNMGISLDRRSRLEAYWEMMLGRPAVRSVLEREGLLQAEPAD
jgi:glutathione S-transferase